jgi:hypothetical protein
MKPMATFIIGSGVMAGMAHPYLVCAADAAVNALPSVPLAMSWPRAIVSLEDFVNDGKKPAELSGRELPLS